MATLASGGRITLQLVDQEIARLTRAWSDGDADDDRELLAGILGEERLDRIDRFDRVQLADVVRVCRQSRSLSDAGRTLFAASRANKKQPNDADRLRKYLARFDLTWDGLARTDPLLAR
jgi:transcriptional regulatory protein RtcR